MSKTQLASIIVLCLAHDGYRRAGVEFAKGENALDSNKLTDAQLGQIKADHRLKVLDGKTEVEISNPEKDKKGTVDTGSVDVTKQFADIVATLEPDNKDHFTNDGKPQLDALKAAGLKMKGKERDEAWAAYSANKEQDDQADNDGQDGDE